jgi:predicted adenine nucleotide alpha hydrolase (AANH) superfamily ATPase
MLIHICCSVDSHYFLQKIQEQYPNEKLIGFFYDPNIHPYSEYKLRLLDVQYSCDILGIELIEGEYDLESWLSTVKGLEQEPEKGDRCTVCFDKRLTESVKKAIELGDDKFTTTLLISPKKSQEKLQTIGETLAKQYGLEFIFKDYRSGNGLELQGKEVKKHNIYRQNYCGCLYGLNAQRESQNKLADELISSIGQQVLPESIEERLQLYKQRNENPNVNIIKQRFLNYRLLSAKVSIKKQAIPSYFLCYSTLKNKKTNGRVEKTINNVSYLNRDEVKIITLEYFNTLSNSNYKNLYELIYNPLKFDEELAIRNKILANSFYDLSCVIVLDYIPDTKLEIFCNSKVYDDVKEHILY